MKISVRLNKGTTSCTVKDTVLALHYIICGEEPPNKAKLKAHIKAHVNDTCYRVVNTWKHDTAKGLSSYVTDILLREVLEPDDKELFNLSVQQLRCFNG